MGAVQGITLVGSIVVNQLIFVAALDFVDTALMWFGSRLGYSGLSFAVSKRILSDVLRIDCQR